MAAVTPFKGVYAINRTKLKTPSDVHGSLMHGSPPVLCPATGIPDFVAFRGAVDLSSCLIPLTSSNAKASRAELCGNRKPQALCIEFGTSLTRRCQRGRQYHRFHCRDSRQHFSAVSSTFPVAQVFFSAADRKWKLEDDISELKELQRQLQPCKNLKEKSAVLDLRKRVAGVFGGYRHPGAYVKPSVDLAIRALDESDLYFLKCLVAIGQEHLLEWPSARDDMYSGPEGISSKSVSGSRVGSVKQVLSWMGNAIESLPREGSLERLWQGIPALETENRPLGHLKVAEKIITDEEEFSCEEVDAGLLRSLKLLVAVLVRLEKFYDSIGGIVGYQLKALELIRDSEVENHHMDSDLDDSSSLSKSPRRHYSVPQGHDLSREKQYATRAASWGLQGLPAMGEIYPLGGAGDRLGLIDELTGDCLPVAMLPYCGRTLLEGLIRDLQAREFLYFKVFGTQQITPVAIMTSAAKQNDERVRALCENHDWFGRGKDNFRFFEQPLVPTVAAADGQWLVEDPLKAVLKPGGHGVIWKLASDEGVFKWFYSKGRKAAIVRQISNPAAATDCTLLALSGIGLKQKKKLGFASCERNVGAAQGVNILMEKHFVDGSREYAVSCIEYTEFRKLGILDVPVNPGSMQAQYPANTNVLYVDLPSVEQVAASGTSASLPGLILNLKKLVACKDQWGKMNSVRGGRLECTMQNVADSLTNKYNSTLLSSDQWKLDTYLTYNHRRKVTSSAKRRRKEGEHSFHQTPEGSFLDITRNGSELLTYCGVDMPQMEGNHCYIDDGPPFLVSLHPSLGPLWDIVRQKIKGGSLAAGSELLLEVAELAWHNVKLDGSLSVFATNIMGSVDDCREADSILQYGLRCGKCRLSDVQILNKGVDWSCKSNVYWQRKIHRLESVDIVLEDDAEFDACGVTIEGSHNFFVPKGHRMIVRSTVSGKMTCKLEALPQESSAAYRPWVWNYNLKENGEVVLTMA